MEVSTEGLLLRGFEQIEARTLDVPFGMVLQPSRYFHVVGPNDNPLMWLIQYEKYTKYSWRSQWWVRAAYLCGNSDEQDWAVRVPSTKFSIETALDWLTPTEVKRALFQGRSVLRQGDFYFVSGDNSEPNRLKMLRDTHHVVKKRDSQGVILVEHPEHPTVRLAPEFSWTAFRQRQMAAQGRRRNAD